MRFKIQLAAVILGCLLFSGCAGKDLKYMKFTGRILCDEERWGGSVIMIFDDYSGTKAPCVLSAAEGASFDGLTDGDLVEVWVKQVRELYPLQSDACKVKKLSDGELSDVDTDILAGFIEPLPEE